MHMYNVTCTILYNCKCCAIVASAPENLTLKQVGPTSVRVSWDPPFPPGNTVGYRVSYNLSNATDIDISDVSTTSTTITGLENGNYYTISIIGLSDYEHFQSEMKNITIYLGMLCILYVHFLRREIDLNLHLAISTYYFDFEELTLYLYTSFTYTGC